ncbi:MAG TPA: hypothetical protein VF178_09895, partial [Gemmatimonadaceae bacterium]
YPRRRGGCRWCGTTPPPSRLPKAAAAGLGLVVVVVAGLGIGNLVGGDDDPTNAPTETMIASANTAASETAVPGEDAARPGSSDKATRGAAKDDRADPKKPSGQSVTSAGGQRPTGDGAQRTPAPPAPAPVAPAPRSSTPREAEARQVAVRETTNTPSTAASESSTVPRPRQAPSPDAARQEASPGWSETSAGRPVNTIVVSQDDNAVPVAELIARPDSLMPQEGDEGVARTWVNVRASTGKDAEVLGILTPDTPVRFGERRGAWIRVTTAELSGWADRRLFAVNR